MTDPIASAVYRSRLAFTLNGDRLHLTHPVRYFRTLCGCVSEGPPGRPDAALLEYRVCSRCQAAYDREMAHA